MSVARFSNVCLKSSEYNSFRDCYIECMLNKYIARHHIWSVHTYSLTLYTHYIKWLEYAKITYIVIFDGEENCYIKYGSRLRHIQCRMSGKILFCRFSEEHFSLVLKGMGGKHRVFHCTITYDMLYRTCMCVLSWVRSRDLIKFIVLLVKVNM